MVMLPIAAASIAMVVLLAYLAGRYAGKRETIPWRPIFQLVEHYTTCLGEDPAAVTERITAALRIPAWAWQEISRRHGALDGSRRVLRREAGMATAIATTPLGAGLALGGPPPLAAVLGASVIATIAAAAFAYRIGYRRGRPPFPEALRGDLARHKRVCLGEPPERVELELTLFLGAAGAGRRRRERRRRTGIVRTPANVDAGV